MRKIAIFAVFVLLVALANAIQKDNKQSSIQMQHNSNVNTLQTKSKWCYGQDDAQLPAECYTFDQDCGFCYSQDFIYECVYNCGNGDCFGASVCSANFLDYCTMSFDICKTCYKRYELCQCPEGMTLNIFANQTRVCSLIPCPLGQYRPNELCSDCLDCDPACAECSFFADNCPRCNEPYCLVDGNKCVDRETYMCPSTATLKLYKLMDEVCFDCVPTCPHGMYPDDITGSCQWCADGCDECDSADTCNFCVPYSGYCMYENKCVQNCPNGLFIRWRDQFNQDQCFDCVQCTDCPMGTYCNNPEDLPYICDWNCLYPSFVWNWQCLEQCPTGTFKKQIYGTDMFECVECSICSTDSVCNSDTHECQQCLPPYVMFNNQCLPVCPDGFFAQPADFDRSVLVCDVCEKCPFGTFCDKETHTCGTCSDRCSECIETSTTCKPPCPPGKYWYYFDCLEICPSDTYPYSNNDAFQVGCAIGSDCFCGDCPEHCSSCIDSNICSGCVSPYVLTTKGTCELFCPDGFYSSNGFCECCNDKCLTCSGASPNECYSCVEGAVQIGNTCYDKWDVQQYYNSQMGLAE